MSACIGSTGTDHIQQEAVVSVCSGIMKQEQLSDYYPRLRELRTSELIPQRIIAEYLGVDQGTYSRYEAGEVPIPLRAICRLAAYYRTSVDYLTGLTDEIRPYPPAR